jgi:hypothetical protein
VVERVFDGTVETPSDGVKRVSPATARDRRSNVVADGNDVAV